MAKNRTDDLYDDEWEDMRGKGRKPRSRNKYAERRAERALRLLDPDALEEYTDDE